MRFKVFLALVLLFGSGAYAQLASPYSNSVWPAQVFTSTGTGAVIQLNGLTTPNSTVGSSFSLATITVTGTNLTTVTFSVYGSSDNGGTYYALPISVVASPSTTPATAVTATANGLYQVSLGGITHVKFVTSGTFTATNVSLVLTASPNALYARGASSGSGGSGTVNTGSAPSLAGYVGGPGTTVGPLASMYSVNPGASINSQVSGLSGGTVLIPDGTPQQAFTPGNLTYEDTRAGMKPVSFSGRGLVCDAHLVTVSLTASSSTATSPNQFQPSDVGRTISAAGTFGGTQYVFTPTITAFSSGSSVTISTASPFSQTNKTDVVGTLDTTAFQNALTYIGEGPVGILPTGGVAGAPACGILTETLAWNNGQSFLGQSILGTVIFGVAAEDILQAPDAAGAGGVSTAGVHLSDLQFQLDGRVDPTIPYTKVDVAGTVTHPTPMYRPGMTNAPTSNNPLGPGWAIGATNGVASITSGSAVICVPVALNRMPISGQQIVFRDTPTIFKTTVSSLTGSGCASGFSPATMAATAPATMSQAEWVSTSSVQSLAVAVTAGAMSYPQTMTLANSISPDPTSESNFATHGRFKLGSEEYVYIGLNYTAKTVNVVAGPATTAGWSIGSAVAPENPCYTNYETPWPVVPTVNSGDSTPSGANYFPAVCGGNAAISFPQANGNVHVGNGLYKGYLRNITVQDFNPDFSIYHGINNGICFYEGGNNASYATSYYDLDCEGTTFGFFVGPASYGMHGVAAVGPTSSGNNIQNYSSRAAYPLIFQDMQQSHFDRMDTYSTGINPYDLTPIGAVTCMAFGFTLDEQTGTIVTQALQNEITNWNCEPENGSHIEVPPFTYSDQASTTFRQDTFEGSYNVFGGNQQTVEGGYLNNPVVDYGMQNNFLRTSLTLNGPVSNVWGVCTFCEWGTFARVGTFFANGGGTIFNGSIGTRQSFDGDSSETFQTGNFATPYGNLLASYIAPDEWNTNGAYDSAPMTKGKTLDSTELYAGSYAECDTTATVFCLPAHFGGFNGIVYIGPHDRVRPLAYDVAINLETPGGAATFPISIWAQNPGGTACSGFTQIITQSITTSGSTWETHHIPIDFTSYTGCNFGLEFGPGSGPVALRIGAVQLIPEPGWINGAVITAPTEGDPCPKAGVILGSDGTNLWVCAGSSAGAGTYKHIPLT